MSGGTWHGDEDLANQKMNGESRESDANRAMNGGKWKFNQIMSRKGFILSILMAN